MKSLSLSLALLLLGAVSASAQTSYPANAPLRVASTHDGLNVTGYRLYVDNARVGVDSTPSVRGVDGIVTLSLPTQPVGSHTVQLAAFNADGETKSDAFAFRIASPAPTKPGTPSVQIVITVVP